MAKQSAKAVREGEEKPFGGSAVIIGSEVNEAHGQLRRRGHTSSMGPYQLTNHMLDSLKGYLENIAAVETQTIVKGVPLAELAASLGI